MKLNYFDAQCSISWKKFLLRKNSDVAVLLMLWQVFLLSFFVFFLSLLSDFFFSCNWRKRSISFNWLVFTLVTNKSLISVIWLKTKFQRSPQSHTKWGTHIWSWMTSNHRMKIREWKWVTSCFSLLLQVSVQWIKRTSLFWIYSVFVHWLFRQVNKGLTQLCLEWNFQYIFRMKKHPCQNLTHI